MARKRYTFKEFSDDMALMGLSVETDLEFTVEDLRKKHRALVKKFHPDKPGGDLEKTKELNVAHDRLREWVDKGRPAWPQQRSEPPKPNAAAEAARAARAAKAAEKAAEAERAEEERRRTAQAAQAAKEAAQQRAETEAKARAAAAAGVERQRRAREAAEREAAEREAARVKAEADQHAEAERIAREAAARAAREREAVAAALVAAAAERRSSRRRLALWVLLWPLHAPLRLLAAVLVRLPVFRLGAVVVVAVVIFHWSTIRQSPVATVLPAVPGSWSMPSLPGNPFTPKRHVGGTHDDFRTGRRVFDDDGSDAGNPGLDAPPGYVWDAWKNRYVRR